MKNIVMPLGISNFEKIRRNNYYYVDKTLLIRDLLNNDRGTYEVNLITRPRRFGKTLAMNMLASFFDIRKNNKDIFDGLEITRYKDICDEYMNKYPTIFFTFKDISGLNFDEAYDVLKLKISRLFIEYDFLLESDVINDEDKKMFLVLKTREFDKAMLKDSILLLTKMSFEYYKKPVILLLD